MAACELLVVPPDAGERGPGDGESVEGAGADRRARPRSSAGIVTSRRYDGVVNAWKKNPSHTSPATSVMSLPTPARNTGGGPHSWAGGEKNGVISVCV